MSEKMDTAKGLVGKWQEAGAMGRARAHLDEPSSVKSRLKRVKNLIKKTLDKKGLMKHFVDIAHPLDLFAKRYEQLTGKSLRADKNPYQLFSALRMSHTRKTRYMVENGMIDLAGNEKGPGLKEAMSLIPAKQMDDFVIYLWAKRSLALLNDPQKLEGRDAGLTREDTEQIITELTSPHFELAANKVYAWNEGVLNYLAQSSPSFKSIVDNIRAADPGYYVPLQRSFEELTDRYVRRPGTGGTLGSPIQRLKGSARPIKNPLATMVSNAETMVRAAHQRAVLDQIVRLGQEEGMGNLIEKIPKDVEAAKVPIAQVVNQLQREMEAQGRELKIEGEDALTGEAFNLLEMDNAAFEGMMTFFIPAKFPKGQDPIVPVMEQKRDETGQLATKDDGSPLMGVEWYYVDANLYETLMGLDIYRLPKAMDIFLGVPTRIARAGITGLNAAFSLIRNPSRDIQTFGVQTTSGARPHQLLAAWAQSLGDAALGKIDKKTNPYFNLFTRLGVDMAQPLGVDSAETKRAIRRLAQQGWAVHTLDPRNIFEQYKDIIQVPEAAPRIAEMRLIAKNMGWDEAVKSGGRLNMEQAVILANVGKRVTTDFTAAGSVMRVINSFAYFANAAIQGPRVLARRLKEDPLGTTLRAVIALTIPSLLLWWDQKDEDWYIDMDWREKFANWHIPIGDKTMLRIPRAFELGAIFSSMPEIFLDAWYRLDPRGVKEWVGYFFDVSVPNPIPQVGMTIAEQRANRVFYWDRPIVTKAMENRPTEEQYNEYTSRVAILMGELLKVSPARIDHLIRRQFGGVGMEAVQKISGQGETGLRPQDRREKEASDIPVIGTLFMRGGKAGSRPQSVTDLYDTYETMYKRGNSIKEEETDDQRTKRLLVGDATRAVTTLFRLRSLTPKVEDRARITKEMTDIAKDALRVAHGPVSGLDRFQMKDQHARISTRLLLAEAKAGKAKDGLSAARRHDVETMGKYSEFMNRGKQIIAGGNANAAQAVNRMRDDLKGSGVNVGLLVKGLRAWRTARDRAMETKGQTTARKAKQRSDTERQEGRASHAYWSAVEDFYRERGNETEANKAAEEVRKVGSLDDLAITRGEISGWKKMLNDRYDKLVEESK